MSMSIEYNKPCTILPYKHFQCFFNYGTDLIKFPTYGTKFFSRNFCKKNYLMLPQRFDHTKNKPKTI